MWLLTFRGSTILIYMYIYIYIYICLCAPGACIHICIYMFLQECRICGVEPLITFQAREGFGNSGFSAPASGKVTSQQELIARGLEGGEKVRTCWDAKGLWATSAGRPCAWPSLSGMVV